jgi:hypothetical protein
MRALWAAESSVRCLLARCSKVWSCSAEIGSTQMLPQMHNQTKIHASTHACFPCATIHQCQQPASPCFSIARPCEAHHAQQTMFILLQSFPSVFVFILPCKCFLLATPEHHDIDNKDRLRSSGFYSPSLITSSTYASNSSSSSKASSGSGAMPSSCSMADILACHHLNVSAD